jgi:hypothetical protein
VFAWTVSNEILIDLDKVGDQGEGLNVYKIWGIRLDGVDHTGVDVQVVVDARDVAANLYGMTYKEGTNEVTFYKPLMPACFRLDKAQFDRRVRAVAGAGIG